MALSLRVKNLLFGGSLAVFAGSVFAYTMHQMSKVRGFGYETFAVGGN
jgi:hypothetical protein